MAKPEIFTAAQTREQAARIGQSWSRLIDGMRLSAIEVAKMAGEAFVERKDTAAQTLRTAADRLNKSIEAKEAEKRRILGEYDVRAHALDLKESKRGRRK